MVKCKYCSKELIELNKYNICTNVNCYFYYVPRFKYKESREVKPIKPKTRMQNVKETAIGIFKDIKTEMGKTINEASDSLENSGIPQNNDAFKTQFGEFDAGGI